MMMSRTSIRKKELQRKVLCSLLAAGVMSVCISGGDVWADDTVTLTQDMLYNTPSEKVNLKDNVILENGGVISIKNADLDGAIHAEKGGDIKLIDAGNITAQSSPIATGSSYYAAIGADAADISIKAKNVLINSGATVLDSGRIMGIYAAKGSDITIDADKIAIDLQSAANTNNDVDRLIAIDNQGNLGHTVTLNSKVITITALHNGQTKYCQGVIGSLSTTNFNGNTTIYVKGEQVSSQLAGAYVQCDPGDSHTTAINFNGGKTDIKVQGGAKFLFAVQGSGVPGSINFTGKELDITAINNQSVSDGASTTAGIYAQYGATINSSAATDITATVQANGYANGIYNTNANKYNGKVKLNGSFTGTVISNEKSAYGIYNDPLAEDSTGGEVYIGKDLKLDVTATSGSAVGIYGEGQYSKTTVLGDVTITTSGKTDSYSLYAADSATITLGSAGKTVDLTGAVQVEGGSVSNHGNVTINGQLLVKADGASSEYTSDGESLRIDAGSSPALQIENSSKKDAQNTLAFNALNTELSSSGDSYIYALSVLNNNQSNVTAVNTINFSGDTTKITAAATDGKAQGVRLGQSNYGKKLTTDISFGAARTTIKVSGNVAADDYYDQVAGIWEGEGSYRDEVATNITFNGQADIDVASLGGNAYGIFVEHGDEIAATVIDFNGDTVIKAQNAGGKGDAIYVSGQKVAVNFNQTQKQGVQVEITGDITAKNQAVITLAGDTNTVKGTVTADAGIVFLAGGDNATYTVDKFVTKDSVSRFTTTVRGMIIVTGGTLNIDNLSYTNKFDLADNSLMVMGKGVLKADSGNLFDKTSETVIKNAVNAKVLFNGGKLAVSDDSYTLADSKAYSTALGKIDEGQLATDKTTIVMTGNLQDGSVGNAAAVEDLGTTGAVHANVTGTVANSTLNIGGSADDSTTAVNNDLGVKDLQFSNSETAAAVNISNGTGLTLVGAGSGDLLKGTAATGNTLTVGGTDSAGTLTLGTAAAVSGGTLNAAVTVGHADAVLNVEAGSFTVEKIEAKAGTVAVDAGAALQTAELTVGTADTGSDTAGAVAAAGTVDVTELTLNKGNVAVTGSLNADTLTAKAGTAIAVGDSGSAGILTAKGVILNGASIVLDPVWSGNDNIKTASKAGLEFASAVDGKLTVGQNSVLSLGTTDISKAETAFAATGLTWGQNDITAALYIDTAQTLDSTNGGIAVDGSLTHASTGNFAAANTAVFADGSLLMLTNSAALAQNGALNTTNGTLTVADGAKLYIANAQANQSYTVVSGFVDGNSAVTDGGWNGTNLLLNKLVKGKGSFSSGSFTVSTEKVKASEALPGVALPNILDAMKSDTNSDFAGIKYLSNAISDLNSDAQAIASVNSFAQGAENSGASHSSVLAAFDIGSIVQDRLSLGSNAAAVRGGFGKAAAEEAGGDIWAQYIHNKDKVDGSYEGQYNGVVIGGDFAPRGKYHSGVAFSYGSGDSTGSASKNEYDFWGLSYYGGLRNADTNLIFDVGYSKTSSDIKGVVTAEPDTQIITLGVKGEKLYENGHGTRFVPYAGLRYMNVDTDNYTGTIDGSAAAEYSPDKANLWLLPVGISISNENVTNDGWKLRPTADIAYVWTMGDNDNVMGVTVPGINASDRIGYDLMDSGFFVGRLGLEAEKGDWTVGVSYSYQKGSDSQSNKYLASVQYSF